MPFLTLRNVRAGYDYGPDILTGLDIDIDAGRGYCIIGPNGAGKSTLLKTIAGLLKPRSGTIEFSGRSVAGLRPDQVLRAGICFVPQDPSLFPDMTVKQNIRMGGFLSEDRHEVEQRMERVFETFPALSERTSQRAATLSGGQQQMLALGRSLMMDPQLIMIDEPSLGLAPMIVDQIFETIHGFTDIGITVLLVEQNARKGLESTDWAFVLDLGTKRFEGPSEGILADPRIRHLYLGKQLSDPEGGSPT